LTLPLSLCRGSLFRLSFTPAESLSHAGFYSLPGAARKLRLADADFVPGGLAAPQLHDNPTELPVCAPNSIRQCMMKAP
jgi:hypothetical protein